jgi:hypothetical protein
MATSIQILSNSHLFDKVLIVRQLRLLLSVICLRILRCAVPLWISIVLLPLSFTHVNAAQLTERLESGFYFPVGGVSSERVTDASFGLCGPKEYPVANVWHCGTDIDKDFGAALQSPVYPVADGIIRRISEGGWSEEGKEPDNFAYIVEHQTNDNIRFLAIYGHLRRPWAFKEGDTVIGGQTKLGELGEWYGNPHLHFGIYVDPNRPDFLPREGYGRQPLPRPATESLFGGLTCYQATNPTYKPSDSALTSYGYWVEPVSFIRTLKPVSSQTPPEAERPDTSDLSGRWEGEAVNQNGTRYEDKVTLLQADGKIYMVHRRHRLNSDAYIVMAMDWAENNFIGGGSSSGGPPDPRRVLEQQGTWVTSTQWKRTRSADGDTIHNEADFADGDHQESTWHRVAKLSNFPKLDNIVHRYKGTVRLSEVIAAGNLKVEGAHNYLLLILNYPGSKLDLIVTDPDGNQLTPNSPGVTYLEKEIPARMYIQNPKLGEWAFRVKGVVVEGEAEPFWLIGTYTKEGPSGKVSGGGGAIGGGIDLQTALLVRALVGVFILGVLCVAVAIRRRSGGSPLPGAAASPIAWLQVHEPGKQPRNVPMTGALARIGRNPSNDIILTDAGVSGQHAEIRVDAGGAVVTDLGSTNGTMLNKQPVQSQILQTGDRIKVGDTVIIYFPSE